MLLPPIQVKLPPGLLDTDASSLVPRPCPVMRGRGLGMRLWYQVLSQVDDEGCEQVIAYASRVLINQRGGKILCYSQRVVSSCDLHSTLWSVLVRRAICTTY